MQQQSQFYGLTMNNQSADNMMIYEQSFGIKPMFQAAHQKYSMPVQYSKALVNKKKQSSPFNSTFRDKIQEKRLQKLSKFAQMGDLSSASISHYENNSQQMSNHQSAQIINQSQRFVNDQHKYTNSQAASGILVGDGSESPLVLHKAIKPKTKQFLNKNCDIKIKNYYTSGKVNARKQRMLAQAASNKPQSVYNEVRKSNQQTTQQEKTETKRNLNNDIQQTKESEKTNSTTTKQDWQYFSEKVILPPVNKLKGMIDDLYQKEKKYVKQYLREDYINKDNMIFNLDKSHMLHPQKISEAQKSVSAFNMIHSEKDVSTKTGNVGSPSKFQKDVLKLSPQRAESTQPKQEHVINDKQSYLVKPFQNVLSQQGARGGSHSTTQPSSEMGFKRNPAQQNNFIKQDSILKGNKYEQIRRVTHYEKKPSLLKKPLRQKNLHQIPIAKQLEGNPSSLIDLNNSSFMNENKS